MTVRLSIRRSDWHRHIHDVARAIDGLAPVVKGNGYGFGREVLHPIADTIANDVCVGTVHELDHVAEGMTPVVLTPTLVPPDSTSPVLTVGSIVHIDVLRGWPGRVLVKIESSMHRYGVSADDLHAVVDRADQAGLDVVGVSIHLPLAGDDTSRIAEVERWLPQLDPALPLWLSHLSAASLDQLEHRHPSRTFLLRLGTALWHGDKSFLHLSADVLDLRHVTAGTTAGYRHATVSGEGHLVLVGAGSANGVASLPDGASPFHFAARRLPLLEPPHMHTSMCFVPFGQPCPTVGDRVDLQRPLITTHADELEWLA